MSIRVKILVVIVLTMFGMLLTLAANDVLGVTRQMRAEKEDRLRWTHRTVVSWMLSRSSDSDSSDIDSILHPLFEGRMISGALLVDESGSPLQNQPGSPYFESPPVKPMIEALERFREDPKAPLFPHHVVKIPLVPSQEGDDPFEEDDEDEEIVAPKQSYYFLIVTATAPPSHAHDWRIAHLLNSVLVFVLGTLFLLFLLYLISSNLLFRTLERLFEASNRIARGDYSPRIPETRRDDEMGQLSDSFGRMLEEVRSYQHDLQSRVDEATQRVQKTERSLVVAQRLSAMGTLAAGIAHEVNNPLGGMINAANRLQSGNLNAEKRELYLDLIVEGLGRVQQTMKNVLHFSPRDVSPGENAVAPIVLRAHQLVQHRFKKKQIQFENRLPETFPTLLLDPFEFQQVFLNLFINAADAVDEGGTIRFLGEVGESKVRLGVQDNGKGMTAEETAQAFDLFFTTKGVGEGTGLGLSIVHNIVTNHRGHIEIESEPGSGTTFWIHIPLSRPNLDS
ncbi:MAG: HAMP domain-containing sensor histidine kinase [Planctomycetota bacterium]|nr:HAMP domain-containing sensor histidine kinase [Planctomycetota bacterium]